MSDSLLVASSSVDSTAVSGSRVSGRSRKSVVHFQPPPIVTKEKEDFVIENGPGVTLGDIENVERRLGMTKATEVEVKKLHSACFPFAKGQGTKLTVKKHIRGFSGYPAEKSKECAAAATEKLSKLELAILKKVGGILDIHISGTKVELVSRIVEFLTKPESSGGSFKAKVGSKRKSSGGSTKKKSPSGKKKQKSKSEDGAASGSESESESESEESASEDEEEQQSSENTEKAATIKKLTAAISSIINSGNMEDLTVGKVRGLLAADFDEATIAQFKQDIKQITNELAGAKNAQE